MRHTGSIKGVVRDATDRPLHNVAVVIVSGPSHSDISALTGPDGTFLFPELRPGRYTIQAYGDQATSDPISLSIRAAKAIQVEIWLEADIVEDVEGLSDVEDVEGDAGSRANGRPCDSEDSVDEI